MIECCGDLILASLDPWNWEKGYQYNNSREDLLYHMSHFMSECIFGLKEPDLKLAQSELLKMSASDVYSRPYVHAQRGVPKYFWEKIPLRPK